ncbi:uncharacterized protein [Euwallacea similis]|uniref:uncharacterized protein isoform X1 n=1 Tax=Euwallacea similis TaxID=1736056 RepID=UPI00344F2331
MLSDADESLTNPSIRVIDFVKNGQNCGFSLTRGKWDPYPWVSNVDQNSVSSLAGLKLGDCLLEVNGDDVVGRKISEIAELVKSKPDKVSLLVWNAGVDPDCSPEALCCGPIPSNLTRLSACMSTILAFLECPVCLDTIAPPTYQCDNGHLICVKCRTKSERCPVCRLKLASGRSLMADQVYNAVIESFNLKEESSDIRSQRIQQIFRAKTKNRNVPNIKITQCHTNRFLAKIVGKKSSSAENLSSNSQLLPPGDSDLKIKSLSTNEIFKADTPTVSRIGSMTRLSRKCNDTTMDDSLTNISDYSNRPSSCHGSFDFLNYSYGDNGRLSCSANSVHPIGTDGRSYYCPFDSKCSNLIKGTKVPEHFQTFHTGPFVQYFGTRFQILLRHLENEACYVLRDSSEVFFVKIICSSTRKEFPVSNNRCEFQDILVWSWYLGSKSESESFEMEVEISTQGSEKLLLRVTGPVFSLNTTSHDDIKDLRKGIFLGSQALGQFDKLILSVNIIKNLL